MTKTHACRDVGLMVQYFHKGLGIYTQQVKQKKRPKYKVYAEK